MPNKFDYAHMRVAETYAELSSAKRLKVGAIIEKDNRLISIGYNGMPSGWSNECEEIEFIEDSEELNYPEMVAEGYTFGADKDTAGWVRRVTRPEVIHAEANAIAKLARSNESGEGAVMYITHSPCMECSKMIYTAGIKKVFYRNHYRNDDGLEFLKKCNIEVEELCEQEEK
jgi:dCMP deaminase